MHLPEALFDAVAAEVRLEELAQAQSVLIVSLISSSLHLVRSFAFAFLFA